MALSINKERFKIYLWIGAAYFGLHLFGDLMTEPGTFFPRFWNNMWLCVFLTVLNYFFFEYGLSYLKFTFERVVLGAMLMFAFLMTYSVGLYAWRAIGISLHIYTPLITHASMGKGIAYHFPYSLMSVVFFALIKHGWEYKELKAAAQQLRIEKQEAELNYLKSQTNPHFLFNTLNNIYSLSRDKSDLAPESILRLSKILRYMLYETGGNFIAIEMELKIIDDYIALEKLRYDESLRVNFNHDIEDMKQAVPPLLLMPLVENAFKHGVSETRDKPFVDIHLSIKNRVLNFVVKNSAEAAVEAEVKENIGLSNLRRQLQLLYTDYNLSVEQKDRVFVTSIRINLASHV